MLRLFSDLDYCTAMRRARKIQRDEAKLRSLGSRGNYANVAIRLTFQVNHRKLYSVYVEPLRSREVPA